MDSAFDSCSDDEVSDLGDIEQEDDETSEHGFTQEAGNPFKTTFVNKHFSILSEFDVKRLQEGDINKVSSVLFIPNASACLLLYHNQWSVTRVLDTWFEDKEKVQKAVGLLNQPQVRFCRAKYLCLVCFQSSDKIMSVGCGHPVCTICWMYYIEAYISKVPSECFTLSCPILFCDAAVDGDMIHRYASASSKAKYDQFLFRSYVENKKMKSCPAPGCDYVVCYEGGGCTKFFYVTCLCHHSFCWSCGEEPHRPVDCETVDQWMKKIQSTSKITENRELILSSTKPCPRCKCPIKKNPECKHMTCNCGFQFCWACLREWSKCDNISCFSFFRSYLKQLLDMDEEEVKTNMERDYSKRYTHCYERWATNDFLRKGALEKLVDLSSVDIKSLSMSRQKLETHFDFMKNAWQQIAECRRILKWTSAYRYFLPENENVKFFEYTQVEAEVALAKLHQCADAELTMFLGDDYPEESRDKFRLKLIDLTNVTKNYFENMMKSLEDGIDDVQATRSTGIRNTSYERGSGSAINIDGRIYTRR